MKSGFASMVKSSFKDLKKSMQNEGGSTTTELDSGGSWVVNVLEYYLVDKLKRGFGMRVPRRYA
ncbi:hypothetical protein F2Q70_00024370 [Brassica cretica]|uniref:Uncharacterized protein n=1 Tax=Brassica cretica TaxID=69181 RepID=A0A8S9L9M0_BRACR|nr:hypothetical protein F2Q70_00024370 [Brassica cretica]